MNLYIFINSPLMYWDFWDLQIQPIFFFSFLSFPVCLFSISAQEVRQFNATMMINSHLHQARKTDRFIDLLLFFDLLFLIYYINMWFFVFLSLVIIIHTLNQPFGARASVSVDPSYFSPSLPSLNIIKYHSLTLICSLSNEHSQEKDMQSLEV